MLFHMSRDAHIHGHTYFSLSRKVKLLFIQIHALCFYYMIGISRYYFFYDWYRYRLLVNKEAANCHLQPIFSCSKGQKILCQNFKQYKSQHKAAICWTSTRKVFGSQFKIPPVIDNLSCVRYLIEVWPWHTWTLLEWLLHKSDWSDYWIIIPVVF